MSIPARSPGGSALPEELRQAVRVRAEGELGLPLFPDSAARVLAAAQDEDSDLERLADLIANDPSLATHLLRVANSAGHGSRMPVLSIPQAIARVGFAAVGDIAMALAVRERVFCVPRHQARIRALWRHSIATAHYAKEIAQLMRRDLDSAFLCGLVHDVGMPMVMQLVCDLERERVVPPVDGALLEAVMHEFHTALGARMAEAWHLGPWIRLVILHHHDPAGARFHPVEIPVVALADRLAEWALSESAQGESAQSEPAQSEPAAHETHPGNGFPAEPGLVAALHLQEGALASLLQKRARVLEVVEAFA